MVTEKTHIGYRISISQSKQKGDMLCGTIIKMKFKEKEEK